MGVAYELSGRSIAVHLPAGGRGLRVEWQVYCDALRGPCKGDLSGSMSSRLMLSRAKHARPRLGLLPAVATDDGAAARTIHRSTNGLVESVVRVQHGRKMSPRRRVTSSTTDQPTSQDAVSYSVESRSYRLNDNRTFCLQREQAALQVQHANSPGHLQLHRHDAVIITSCWQINHNAILLLNLIMLFPNNYFK